MHSGFVLGLAGFTARYCPDMIKLSQQSWSDFFSIRTTQFPLVVCLHGVMGLTAQVKIG